MKKTITYTLTFLGLLFQTFAQARSYYFKSYEVENGLSNNNVTCCTQDRYGFMWFGTRDGLNRFDGNTFRIFKNEANRRGSLISSWITDLARSPSGNLWVATNMGVQIYDYQQSSFRLLDFTKGMACSNLTFDNQGNVWMILNGNTLLKYNEQLGLYQNCTPQDNSSITSFCMTRQGQLWVTTANGHIALFNLEENKFTRLPLFNAEKEEITIPNMTAIWASPSDPLLLVGTSDQGIKRIDIRTGLCRNILSKQKTNPIYTRDFFQATADEVWIATYSGIYIYHLVADKIFHLVQNKSDHYSLSNNAIKEFARDREGGIWICTDNGGINYLAPYLKFRLHYMIPGQKTIQGDIIHDICPDAYNHVWIGTEDAGLNKFDLKTRTYTSFTDHDGLSQNCIHGLATLGKDLWIGTHSNGIDRMDIRSGKIVKHYSIGKEAPAGENNIIVYLYKTRSDRLLVATATGVYQYNPLRDTFDPMQQFPADYRIQTLFEDDEGTLWAGTFNRGLYYFNPQTQAQGEFLLDTIGTHAHRTINHIHEDKQKNLWFATGEGLKMLQKHTRKILCYSTRDGLPSNVIYRLEEDTKGHIWISTSNGLAVLNPSTREIKVFKKEHGLPGNQFNYNSSARTADGKLYFGTLKGMISFDPEPIQDFPIRPKVYMVQIKYTDPNHNWTDQQNITFRSHITLDYNQSTFYIEYAALSYQAPTVTQYAYCMEGLNPEWNYVIGENRAYFTKLPPGNYTFKVKAANISGLWNEDPASLHITILPPWWFSSVALTIYVVLGIGAICLAAGLITRHNRQKMRRKMNNFENEKEKELYQAKIDFFINIAHEIRTPLTLIKSPLHKLLTQVKLPPGALSYLTLINKNANRLLDLVNQLLDFRKTEIEGYKLNFIETDIIALIYETCEHFKEAAEQAHLSLLIETSLPSFYVFIDKEACTKILSNLLSNAVKYAKSEIRIKFNVTTDTNFIVDVINDGEKIPEEIQEKIFEPFFREETNFHKSGTGLGLPLARSLAEMHDGTLTLLSCASPMITFRLCLPIHQPHSIKLTEKEKEVETKEIPSSYITHSSRSTILVVEDNPEMLNFIGEEINRTYNVATASNGQEAIGVLKEVSIQLIISDIMMPVMDGLALLKKVKTDIEFSHIPIILLTAKSSLQARMEGLEMGADAYIDKPFSTDLLLTQITNLLNNRNNIRSYYFNSPLAHMKSMAYTKADENFLKKLNAVIDTHISDIDLDVDMLADEMNLSRPTLYRKINALSDMTPNDLIKISRLKKAAELILQGEMRIYEIAEAVGFNSQSYFSRAFSKQFNMSPTQYAKANNVELK